MNTDKQNQARTLYFQTDLDRTEIANMLGIPRRTLHHWITTHHWDRQKKAAAHMPAFLAENCYHIIAKLQEHLLSDERANTPITRHEADTMHKMVLTISKMNSRATLNESMEMMEGFMDSVHANSPEMVAQVMPLVENYIASRSSATPQQFRAKQMSASRTPTEQEIEDELDRQDMLAWAAEGYSPGMDNESEPPVQPHEPVTIKEDAQQIYKARRQSPPDYKELIAEFRRQDENVRHMFPHNTRPQAA